VAGGLASRSGTDSNLAQAARRADGRIEYGSEFEILAPEQPSAGNRVLLFDVENPRPPGHQRLYNTPVDPAGLSRISETDFSKNNGYTVVSIHWEDGHGIRLPTYPGAGGKPAPLLAVGFAAIRDFAPFCVSRRRTRPGRPIPGGGDPSGHRLGIVADGARVESFLFAGFNRAENIDRFVRSAEHAAANLRVSCYSRREPGRRAAHRFPQHRDEIHGLHPLEGEDDVAEYIAGRLRSNGLTDVKIEGFQPTAENTTGRSSANPHGKAKSASWTW